ncbi:MAG: hypothetical protein QXH10_10475 [Ignisphaera sp.]
MITKHYNIHDLVHIITNLHAYIPNYFLDETIPQLKDLDLVILGLTSVNKTENNHKIFFTGSIVGEGITFSDDYLHAKINTPFIRMLGLNSQIDMLIKRYYNGYMITLSPLAIMGLPLVSKRVEGYLEKLFRILIILRLIKKGYLLLHAAGVAQNDNYGIILCAFSNTGKTPLAQYFYSKLKFKFMGDDHIILSPDGTLLAYPEPSRMFTKLSSLIFEKIPASSFILGEKSEIFVKYLNIDETSILPQAKLRKIFILKRGRKDIKKLNNDEILVHKLKVLNFEEILSSLSSPFTCLINYGSFVNLFPTLDELFRKSAQILNEAITRSNIDAYEITFKTFDEAYTLISKVLFNNS